MHDDGNLENIPVRMIRPHLRDIPQIALPPGFHIRPMVEADIPAWTDIERDCEQFLTIDDGLFLREFGSDLSAIAQRCFLIETEAGYPVSTISAWYNPPESGLAPGRIHWVATCRAYQRRGLARAGLSYALSQLAQWHDSAMLATSTGRLGAIRLYLEFGFIPDMSAKEADRAWNLMRQRLGDAFVSV